MLDGVHGGQHGQLGCFETGDMVHQIRCGRGGHDRREIGGMVLQSRCSHGTQWAR